jgi:hypothetical protein
MHADCTATDPRPPRQRAVTAPRPPRLRSRATNGTALFAESIDGRTALARRYRDLIAQFVADVGGDPSQTQQQVIRRAASLSVWCESVEAKLAAGEEIDIGQFTTACNSVRRLLADIGLSRHREPMRAIEATAIEPAVAEPAEAAAEAADAPAPASITDTAERLRAILGPLSPSRKPAAAPARAPEPEPEPIVPVPGDYEVVCEGRARLVCRSIEPDGREKWDVMCPARGSLGCWIGRDVARARAEQLDRDGRLYRPLAAPAGDAL